MGDRFVVGFKSKPDSVPVWLYSHWGGTDRHTELGDAIIAAKPRWGDPAYATRICISQFIGPFWENETGFGISAGDDFCLPDYTDVAVVTWSTRTVDIVYDGRGDTLATHSFEEFLRLTTSMSHPKSLTGSPVL